MAKILTHTYLGHRAIERKHQPQACFEKNLAYLVPNYEYLIIEAFRKCFGDKQAAKLVESVTETIDARADDTFHVLMRLVLSKLLAERFKDFCTNLGKYLNVIE